MKKRLTLLLSGLLLSLFLINPTNIEECLAYDLGEESMKTFLLTTNGNPSENAEISFDAGETSYSMELLQTSGNSSLFAIDIENSKVSNQVYFYGDSFSFNTNVSNTYKMYKCTSTATGSYVSNSVGQVCNYKHTSYQTRRLWFTLSENINGFLGVYSSPNRYMTHQIYNNNDGLTYYYVDVPVDLTSFSINYINVDVTTNNSMISSTTYSNDVLHKIRYINVNGKTISDHSLDSCDQYFVNKYLEGFSSCLDDNRNGYQAYPYISNIIAKYEPYGDGSLNSVYQDDYEITDYNNEYSSSSYRGCNLVSAEQKLNQIRNAYQYHYERKNIVINQFDNNDLLIAISVTTLFTLISLGYFMYLRRKESK